MERVCPRCGSALKQNRDHLWDCNDPGCDIIRVRFSGMRPWEKVTEVVLASTPRRECIV